MEYTALLRNVDFSFCLIFIRKLNFSSTESILTGKTSFCQSTWHGFFLCMGKCYTSKDTHIWRCVWNIILYNIFEFLPNILVLLTDGKSTIVMLTDVKPTLIKVMTDVIVKLLFTTNVWQMLLPCGIWPLIIAFVTDVIVTFCGMDPLLR